MVNAYKPATLDEAVAIRVQTGAVPLAGGTDLMVRRKNVAGALPKFSAPVMLVAHLPELRQFDVSEEVVSIGAAITLAEIEDDPRVPEVLRQAVSSMAARNVRHIATIGGNVCNASPAGDTLVPLYALDARLILASPKGEKTLPIEDFILGPGKTAIGDDELLVRIEIPRLDYDRIYYRKVGTRKAMALSKVSFAGLARLDGETVEDIRFSFGSVAPTVVRRRDIEVQIEGLTRKEVKSRVQEWRELYSPYIRPIDDQRSTSEYRKKVSLNLLEYFITDVL